MTIQEKIYCSCCGYNTISEQLLAVFDICRICGWEEDVFQSINPNNTDGVNGISLIEAQQNFENFGVYSINMVEETSKPKISDVRKHDWKII